MTYHKTTGQIIEDFRCRLADFYIDDEIEEWLNAPNDLLNGCSAMELIDRGDSDLVEIAISRLEDMTYL